jgi:hypothetical protein
MALLRQCLLELRARQGNRDTFLLEHSDAIREHESCANPAGQPCDGEAALGNRDLPDTDELVRYLVVR